MVADESGPSREMEDTVRPEQDFAWWQKLLIKAKIWQPPHLTMHHVVRDMERPVPPPVTGAYGNEVVTATRPRLVPQRDDNRS